MNTKRGRLGVLCFGSVADNDTIPNLRNPAPHPAALGDVQGRGSAQFKGYA